MPANVITGNAQSEGSEHRGWFLGGFMTPSTDPRSTSALEVKWGVHPAGDRRAEWTEPARTTTLSILISGQFSIQFPEGDVLLHNQGDYALWLPGVIHSWRAEEDSVILTVRWPSLP